MTRMNRNNTSGFRGVRRSGLSWVSQITADGHTRYLGSFDTAQQASEAFERAKAEWLKAISDRDQDKKWAPGPVQAPFGRGRYFRNPKPVPKPVPSAAPPENDIFS